MTVVGTSYDVTDPSNPIEVGADRVKLDITDRDNSSNMLGITRSRSGSVMLSSNWNDIATQQQTIDNGRVQVH